MDAATQHKRVILPIFGELSLRDIVTIRALPIAVDNLIAAPTVADWQTMSPRRFRGHDQAHQDQANAQERYRRASTFSRVEVFRESVRQLAFLRVVDEAFDRARRDGKEISQQTQDEAMFYLFHEGQPLPLRVPQNDEERSEARGAILNHYAATPERAGAFRIIGETLGVL